MTSPTMPPHRVLPDLGDWRWTLAPRHPAEGPILTLPGSWVGALHVEAIDRVLPDVAIGDWRLNGAGSCRFAKLLDLGGFEAVSAHFASLERFVVMLDSCDGSYALGWHTAASPDGGVARSRLGALLHDAKPYDGRRPTAGQRRALSDITDELQNGMEALRFLDFDLVVSIPASDPDREFDFGAMLARPPADALGIEYRLGGLRRCRRVRQMKNVALEDKRRLLEGSMAVTSSVDARRVLIVDDLYQSGTTIAYAAGLLRQAGAARVSSLCVVKTLGGRDNTSWAR